MSFMTINNTAGAYMGGNVLNKLNNDIQTATQRLATGLRINSAKDDPSGMAIANKLKAQMGSWTAAEKNITSGNSLLEASDNALTSVNDILIEMRDIATQASSDDLDATQRTALANAFTELQGQIDNIVDSASINGKNLVGTAAATVDIQYGISGADQKTLAIGQSDAATLGVDSGSIDISSAANAQSALADIDTAMGTVATNQSVMGAASRGLDLMYENAGRMKTSLEASRSRIEDADIAKESSDLSKLQLKQQSTIAMLGVIQSAPQSLLGLLRF